MARKSRKESVAIAKVPEKQSGYKTAMYVRLSREDERKIESDTVENQIAFLKDFVSKDETLNLTEIYVDRHVTGTKFDRPQFNQMIADIRSGKINCVVVKDLSRLGRNYLEAGDYIEKIFPFFGVRFIAVTDNYDSLTSNPSEDGLIVPLKNLINEAYAKDISKKIDTSFENMFKQGIFLATTAAYGYKKDPDDPHMVLVDEEVKDIVIRIYVEFLTGSSLSQIARGLNADGILAPSVYWQEKGVIHKQKYTNKWESKMIRRIIENPIYTGDIQIGKTKKCYYKGITKPMNRDGYYFENHHEGIVSHEMQRRALELLSIKKKAYHDAHSKDKGVEKNTKEDMLQGILYCAHCGNKMNLYRKTVKLVSGVGHYSTYICRRSATYGDADPKKNIKAEKMEAFVLELIKTHIVVYVESKERLKALNKLPKAVSEKSELDKKLLELQGRYDKVADFIKNLYEDFADGVFSEDEYLEMKAEYVAEQEALSEEIATVREQASTYEASYSGSADMQEAFNKYLGVSELSRDLVLTFIKKITCYDNNRFEVEYTFTDELAKLMDLIEERGADVA